MKQKTMLIGLFALGFILVFFGIATGAGGPLPDPTCKEMVDQATVTDASPLIQGTFTAAYRKDKDSNNTDKYVVRIHIVCERPYLIVDGTENKEVVIRKLFDYDKPDDLAKHLCAHTNQDIKDLYKYAPCMWEIGKEFDLGGIPVLTNVSVTERSNTCSLGDGMGWISGTLKIRIVPISQD